ncbi:MAG: YwiC-like family protein [Mobilicoccus sp.]|nr:YwiC-like family protein [Mobilicoccus sp.]
MAATDAGTKPRGGAGAPASRRRGGSRGWVPRQHGAWAMLVVPFVVGAVHGGPAWPQGALLISWIVGYMGFAAAGLWLKARPNRRAPYRAPILVYGSISLLAGLILVAARPSMALWALVFAPFAAVSLLYSARREERALTNDVVTIIAACLIAPVAAHAGALGAPLARDPLAVVHLLTGDTVLVGMTLALATYFVGTSLYVKTLIRERTSRAYKWASIGYHALATLLWALVPVLLPGVVPGAAHALLTGFFVVTTVRAAVLAGHRVRPMHVGLGEIVLSTALALILLLAW